MSLTPRKPQGWGAWWAWASLVVMPSIALLLHLTIGLRVEHVGLCVLIVALAWTGPKSRLFTALTAPMVATGLAYDFLRLVRHWRAEHIHVADLWHAEAALFPWPGEGSLGDAIARHTHPIVDVVTGAVYITYLPVAAIVAGILYLRSKRAMATLSGSFALVSVLGWIVWLAWPAAPPWYVDTYGLGPAILDATPSAAGALRFDHALGVDVFGSFYERSWNVFGAMPSLHVGYAVIVAAAAWPMRGWIRHSTLAYALIMSFGAVYLRHHYILDVVAGLVLGLISDRAVAAGIAVVSRRRNSRPDGEEVSDAAHHQLAHR